MMRIKALAMLGVAVWQLLSAVPGAGAIPPAAFATPKNFSWWHEAHANLTVEVATADAGQGLEMLFLGDSIIEILHGTLQGKDCRRCWRSAEVFQRHVGSKYRAAALGIAGDSTANLMWRLLNGELPKAHQPRLVALLIGTNDLRVGASGGEAGVLKKAPSVIQRTKAIVRCVRRQLPAAEVALLGLLPRGGLGAISAPDKFAQPSIFTAGLERVNQLLRRFAERDERLHYVGCDGALLLADNGSSLLPSHLPDALHPSSIGYEAQFSQCWGPALDTILATTAQLT